MLPSEHSPSLITPPRDLHASITAPPRTVQYKKKDVSGDLAKRRPGVQDSFSKSTMICHEHGGGPY
jgi:hypothetical protein